MVVIGEGIVRLEEAVEEEEGAQVIQVIAVTVTDQGVVQGPDTEGGGDGAKKEMGKKESERYPAGLLGCGR